MGYVLCCTCVALSRLKPHHIMHTILKTFRFGMTALLLGVTLTASAQTKENTRTSAASFGVGDKTFAVGFGLGLGYGYLPGTSVSPSLVAIYDQGIKEGIGPGVIGLGGIVGYKSARYDYGTSDRARWTNVIVAARGTYHVPLGDGLENLDVYGGLMAGLRFFRYSDEYLYGGYDANYVRLASGLFAGARYNFTQSLGAWAEIGYDVALIKAGLHVNF